MPLDNPLSALFDAGGQVGQAYFDSQAARNRPVATTQTQSGTSMLTVALGVVGVGLLAYWLLKKKKRSKK